MYDQIVQYLGIMGYPTDTNPDSKDSINHLVYANIGPITVDFKRATGHKSIRLLNEKDIVSTDC